ncbi:MAG: hypothetical protein EBT63_01620 [Proteobacteria bacterium]|nr:hypothetical protein [Pseudomonadota bacterium]NCA27736.1 hypothetical protein [Pseudomonadota bacterium]
MNDNRNNRERFDSRPDLPIERNALIELTKKEQEHRHKLQENQQKANNTSYFFGMVFGLFYNLALLYFIYDLVEKGFRSLALKLFIINAGIIVISFGLLSFSRKFTFRKTNHVRHGNNKRFNRTKD